MTNKELEKINGILEKIIRDTLWMARRYADLRSTFAPNTVNRAIDDLRKIGIEIQMDHTLDDPYYAQDGMLGKWDSEKQKFSKE